MATLDLPDWTTAPSIPKVQRTRERLGAVLVGLCYWFGLGTLASALRVEYGFPLDDSWIHQTIARNLAQTGVVGFHAGVPSPGSTSILWTFIQAANFRILHLDPVLFNLLLSALLLPTIGVLLLTLLRQDHVPASIGYAVAATPALAGNFLWLGLIGMEHLLLVALMLAGILFWFQSGRPAALLAGTCLALMTLARPEAIIIGPLCLLAARAARRGRRDVLLATLLWCAGVALALEANLYTCGSLLPGTLQGRSWLYFRQTGGPHSLHSVFSFLFVSAIVRPYTEFPLWFAHISTAPWLTTVSAICALALACTGARSLFRNGGPRTRLLLLIGAAHFGFFLFAFPTEGHGGRYQPLSLLLLFPFLFLGLSGLLTSITPRHGRKIAAALLLTAGLGSLLRWRSLTIDSISHINHTHGCAAEWIREHTAPDATVAAFDIGKIGYSSNRNLIDLGGLTNLSLLPYMTTGHVSGYLAKRRADWIVLPSGPIAQLLGIRQPGALVASFCSPAALWEPVFAYTRSAEQCQLVFRRSTP